MPPRTTCSDHKHISLHTYFAARTLRRIFQVRVMHQKLSSEKMERNRRQIPIQASRLSRPILLGYLHGDFKGQMEAEPQISSSGDRGYSGGMP